MRGAGLYDGDILVVDRSLEPKHHDIVIAVLDGELTVKRLYCQGDLVQLRPRLGLKRTTLQAMVKRLGIDRPSCQANISAPAE
jgi:peptidase S24-like protein